MMIVEVALPDLVLPTDQVDMALAQVRNDLQQRAGGGWCLTGSSRASRDNHVESLLAMALASRRPTFVALPEYSLPVGSVSAFVGRVASAEQPLVAMAGLEAMSAHEFRTLVAAASFENREQSTEGLEDHQWVNSALVVIKDASRVRWYLQAKRAPSQWEHNSQSMYRGRSVLLFRSASLSFICLICFDAIGDLGNGRHIADGLLAELESWGSYARPFRLDFVFVLQHNESPDSPAMLLFPRRWFNCDRERVVSRDTSIVMVNSAARAGNPIGEGYGRNTICFADGLWVSPNRGAISSEVSYTFAIERMPTDGTGRFSRVRFRSRRPSLFSSKYTLPAHQSGASTSGRLPLGDALRIPLTEVGPALPRIDPAIVDVADEAFTNVPTWLGVGSILASAFEEVRAKVMESQNALYEWAAVLFMLAQEFIPSTTDRPANPDRWRAEESDALCEAAAIIAALSVAEAVDLPALGDGVSARLGQKRMRVAVVYAFAKSTTAAIEAYMKRRTSLATLVVLVGNDGIVPPRPTRYDRFSTRAARNTLWGRFTRRRTSDAVHWLGAGALHELAALDMARVKVGVGEMLDVCRA